jgi:hypothetical protein
VGTGVDVRLGVAVGSTISVTVGTLRVTVGVGVAVPSPITGIPGSAVRVAAATVWAMAVLITFKSGVGCPGAQAASAISSTELIKSFRIVFGIFPPFGKRVT